MQVRGATRADLLEIGVLAASAPEAPHWPASAWQSFSGGSLAESPIRRGCLVASTPGGELMGWIAGSLVQEVAEVESLFTVPAWRRCGVAVALLESWRAWAHAGNAGEIVLEVRAGNAAALALYSAFGFTVVGRRRAYYRDPVEDAVLLRLQLPIKL